jgi:cell shape-determining protein MreD
VVTMESMVLWVVSPVVRKMSEALIATCFLLGLLFDLEDGDEIFL